MAGPRAQKRQEYVTLRKVRDWSHWLNVEYDVGGCCTRARARGRRGSAFFMSLHVATKVVEGLCIDAAQNPTGSLMLEPVVMPPKRSLWLRW
jgi:hypothetical protein